MKLGSEKLTDISKRLGFGDVNHLYDEWNVRNGNFPNSDDLQSKGQLALLGFGQGKLTDSPASFSSVIAAIANGGIYKMPQLVSGSVDDSGKVSERNENEANRAMSEDTAKTIREYMRYVVSDGSAEVQIIIIRTAGKTSTAQSGRMEEDKEILYTWFAGFILMIILNILLLL